MKYFLDSAKLDEITYAYDKWGIDGVTTNPKHIYLSGKDFKTVVTELAKEFEGIDFPISVEINPHLDNADEMITQAKEVADISNNFVIKIPCNEAGLIASKKLGEAGVKTNVTLIFSASQAIQALRTNPTFISPFVGWKESAGENTDEYISSIVEIVDNYGYQSEVIVAAIRTGKQLVDAALMCAHITTAGMAVYRDSFQHPFTDFGLKKFQEAWDMTEK